MKCIDQDSELVKSTVNLKWLIILFQIYQKNQARKKNVCIFKHFLQNEVAINGSEITALQQVMETKILFAAQSERLRIQSSHFSLPESVLTTD